MDALSETLRVVRLVGAIFLHGRFTAPWCYQSPHADSAAPLLEPTAERVVIFHLITEGECWVELDGQPPVHLPATAVEVFDVSGAGDTVAATLALAMAAGSLDTTLVQARVSFAF